MNNLQEANTYNFDSNSSETLITDYNLKNKEYIDIAEYVNMMKNDAKINLPDISKASNHIDKLKKTVISESTDWFDSLLSDSPVLKPDDMSCKTLESDIYDGTSNTSFIDSYCPDLFDAFDESYNFCEPSRINSPSQHMTKKIMVSEESEQTNEKSSVINTSNNGNSIGYVFPASRNLNVEQLNSNFQAQILVPDSNACLNELVMNEFTLSDNSLLMANDKLKNFDLENNMKKQIEQQIEANGKNYSMEIQNKNSFDDIELSDFQDRKEIDENLIENVTECQHFFLDNTISHYTETFEPLSLNISGNELAYTNEFCTSELSNNDNLTTVSYQDSMENSTSTQCPKENVCLKNNISSTVNLQSFPMMNKTLKNTEMELGKEQFFHSSKFPLLKANIPSTSSSNQHFLLFSDNKEGELLKVCGDANFDTPQTRANKIPIIVPLVSSLQAEKMKIKSISKNSDCFTPLSSSINFNSTKNSQNYVYCTNSKTDILNSSISEPITSIPKGDNKFHEINKSTISITPLLSSVPTNSGNTQSLNIIFLDKKISSLVKSDHFVSNDKMTCKTSVTTNRKLATKIGQRRKTVRELLQEKQRKKTFESIVQNCLTNTNKSSFTLSNESNSEKQKTSNIFTSTGNKPSILMLNSDLSNFDQRKTSPYFTKSTISPLNTYLNSTPATMDNFLSSEDDVDDPESYCSISKSTNPRSFYQKQRSTKSSRPKHFDMYFLKIGKFKVEDDDFYHDEKYQYKFKVFFTKRQFIYEFPMVCYEKVNTSLTEELPKLACIVVPFSIVTAINCFEEDILIKVSSAPKAYFGSKQQKLGLTSSFTVFDVSRPVDITSGEAEKCFVHKIILRQKHANKLKTMLLDFDDRFKICTNISQINNELSSIILPYEMESSEEFDVLLKRTKKEHKFFVRPLPPVDDDGYVIFTRQICSCRMSCSNMRCSCAKGAQPCNSDGSLCICSNCNNPLNILESIGIDPKRAVLDSCLFQNIYDIIYLHRYLSQRITLPCCSYSALVQECIPGNILCPNTNCMESVQFSWCRNTVCLTERNPRNHCNVCGNCRFSNGFHCETCGLCYVKKPGTNLCCPKCNKSFTTIK